MQRYSIYQLKSGVQTRFLRWKPYQQLLANGFKPDFANYMHVYSGETAKEGPDKILALCVILFGLSHATAIESSIIYIDPDTTTVSPNQSDYTPDAKIGKSQNELYNKNRINLPTNVISTEAFYANSARNKVDLSVIQIGTMPIQLSVQLEYRSITTGSWQVTPWYDYTVQPGVPWNHTF